MSILIQFVLRLSFGLALGMGITSPRLVTSGYYRNHLYVLLGLNVLASLAAFSAPEQFAVAPPVAAAIVSYLGAVCWLYEKPVPGLLALWLIAGLTLWGAIVTTDVPSTAGAAASVFALADPTSSGLVLGLTLAAMFLGHWYLNTPTMAIGPLQRLVVLMGVAICLRGVVAGAELGIELSYGGAPTMEQVLFLALRWLSGIAGALGLVVMTLATLKIPNTQSATGILYVAVIATFLGELTSLLLHAQAGVPSVN